MGYNINDDDDAEHDDRDADDDGDGDGNDDDDDDDPFFAQFMLCGTHAVYAIRLSMASG